MVDRMAAERLMHQHKHVARIYALRAVRRVPPQLATLEELHNAALTGIFQIALKFDPTKGTFTTYLIRRLHGAIVDYLREVGPVKRVRYSHGGKPPKTYDFSPRGQKEYRSKRLDRLQDWHPDLMTHPATDPPDIESLLRALPERARECVRLHYLKGLTQAQIAKLIHLSASRVSQILQEAIQRLRENAGCTAKD